ncbi:DUF2076 domain-containing protein [Acetobacteraceae bacterium H6797]|nr:DUF2076 domain-containing protein [Acetobacteraceae bacterium H6797]
MTEEERRIISAFVERLAGVSQARPASPWGGSSVPSTQSRPPLPPVDPEADALIAELFARYPEARYRITQTAFVQENALVQAQNRIQDLEWQLENAQAQAQQAQQAAPQRGGLFGGMFGGGNRPQPGPMPMSPRPQPVQPPMGYAPMQSSGPGFLGSALTTAAGVAGGMVMGNMLMNMFSGHHGAAEAASAATSTASGFGQEAVSPWTNPGGTDQSAQNQDATPTSWDDASSQDAYPDDAAYDAGADDAGWDDDV